MRIYGPVPSRRFGLSLGVDVVPRKVCSHDCIYCQVGPTDRLTAEVEAFYPVEEILADVARALEDGPMPDVVTLAGAGEPTLYSELGALIDGIHALAPVKVVLITNSALLWRDDVAAAAMKADVLVPSLDAGDAAMFERINRPAPGITFELFLDGLSRATDRHPGEVRLEVMLLAGINDDEASMSAIAKIARGIRHDRLDLNTPVRPPVPERGAMPCDAQTLARAVALFGPKASAIGKFERRDEGHRAQERRGFDDFDKDVLETLLRRPCTAEELAASLGASLGNLVSSLERLGHAGLVESRTGAQGVYFVGLKK